MPEITLPLTARSTASSVSVTLHINGTNYHLSLDPHATLLDVLREADR
ncbi:MAG: hypothetical protein F6K28_30905 [Microcoleus sp. SIO2G3]|nr:hypothetical protein [Microcoleus sp. SIO2G3]